MSIHSLVHVLYSACPFTFLHMYSQKWISRTVFILKGCHTPPMEHHHITCVLSCKLCSREEFFTLLLQISTFCTKMLVVPFFHKRLRRHESEAINIEAEEAKTQQMVRQINTKKCKCLSEMKEKTRDFLELSLEKVRLSLRYAEAAKEVSTTEVELREQSSTLQNLQVGLLWDWCWQLVHAFRHSVLMYVTNTKMIHCVSYWWVLIHYYLT